MKEGVTLNRFGFVELEDEVPVLFYGRMAIFSEFVFLIVAQI